MRARYIPALLAALAGQLLPAVTVTEPPHDGAAPLAALGDQRAQQDSDRLAAANAKRARRRQRRLSRAARGKGGVK